jgi:DNA-binding protein HU-beta
MNKADLTERLAEQAGIPKVRAANYINILTEAIQESLVRGEKVTISDFGTFTVSKRRAFIGHNPKNGEEMQVPERHIPVFRAGKGMKNALNAN